ncbi:delta-60 repeat domain-containing protein [Calidithermus chliarophilus]|uniref:delta-60 repeat domain-containing protein n=1 Tax=Calidithermus chliarophilus TaxID=52023 RepID=UPI0023AAD2B7|nr:delta-60 repeat domain-containing protein [Calidithermus chliarophilus]
MKAGSGSKAFALLVQPDGKLVVGGLAYTPGQDFALARFNPDGTLDTQFGDQGVVTTDLGGSDVIFALALQPGSKIVAAGGSGGGAGGGYTSSFALARYNPDGSLDASFDADGKVVTDFAGAADSLLAMRLQADGRIVVAGWRELRGAQSELEFAVARYWP